MFFVQAEDSIRDAHYGLELDVCSSDLHRQHPRHRGIDQRHLRVRLRPERRRGARKQLGVGRDLGVDLKADHDLPFAGFAFDAIIRHHLTFLVSLRRQGPITRRFNLAPSEDGPLPSQGHRLNYHHFSARAVKPARSSIASPAFSTPCSSNALPIICKPSGSPSRFSAAGTDIAGSPARLAGTANTSFKYIASGSAVFSPSPNAADGAVGARDRKSTRQN